MHLCTHHDDGRHENDLVTTHVLLLAVACGGAGIPDPIARIVPEVAIHLLTGLYQQGTSTD